MGENSKAASSLYYYSSQLDKRYSDLLQVLALERDDIINENIELLVKHSTQEQEIVFELKNLTAVINTYLEKITADEVQINVITEINIKKETAQKHLKENSNLLKSKMSLLRKRIDSGMLPKTGRRVYYSGNNSQLMDIFI